MQDQGSVTPPTFGEGGGADEERLLQAVAIGEVADLEGGTIRAEFLRALVFGREEAVDIPAFGVRIRNATIAGTLHLDGCIIPFPLILSDVRLASGADAPSLTMRDAQMRRIALHGVTADGSLLAERAVIDNGMIGEGLVTRGYIALDGCRIGHTLALIDSTIGDGKAAIAAAGLRVEGAISLRRSTLQGGVLLQRARATGGFYGEAMTIATVRTAGESAESRPALSLESASFDGDLLIAGSRISGPVTMENARFGGRVEAVGCNVEATGDGWNMDGFSVRHGVCLDDVRLKGVLRLAGADIGKLLTAHRIKIEGGETAVHADLLRLGGNFEMTDATLVGQLRCPGAEVQGQLRLTATKLFGSELAIRGDGSRVQGGCFFSRAQIIGLVRFPASHFGNQFRLRGALIKVEHGPALLAPGARFARDIELSAGFESIGAIILDQAVIAGTCDLGGSRIKSAACVRAGTTAVLPRPPKGEEAQDEAVFSLVDATVGRLQMPAHSDERPRGVVNLSRARIGAYEDWANAWPPAEKRRTRDGSGRDIDHLVLDGLVYEHLVNPAGVGGEHHSRDQDRAGQRRLQWLDGQHHCDVAEHFRPQPWVQLAGRLAAQGLTGDARKVAIERRRRERRSHAATTVTKWESRLLDWVALFGFNPWRTVLWSVLVIMAFTGVWSWAASQCEDAGCFDQKVFVTTNLDAYGSNKIDQVYPAFHPAGYALDNFVPFVSLGYADHWRPNERFGQIAEFEVPNIPVFLTGETDRSRIFTKLRVTVGGLLYLLTLLEQMIGLVLISLVATGFTGILRDET